MLLQNGRVEKETDKKWTEGGNMVFKTTGNKSEPVVLFFHAMGVTGESSMPVADKLAGKFYCIMPTSTVYCSGQRLLAVKYKL